MILDAIISIIILFIICGLYSLFYNLSKNKSKLQRQCPLCGSTMHYKNKLQVITYSDQTKEIEILAWWCERCGDGILDHNALEESENAWIELKKRSHK